MALGQNFKNSIILRDPVYLFTIIFYIQQYSIKVTSVSVTVTSVCVTVTSVSVTVTSVYVTVMPVSFTVMLVSVTVVSLCYSDMCPCYSDVCLCCSDICQCAAFCQKNKIVIKCLWKKENWSKTVLFVGKRLCHRTKCKKAGPIWNSMLLPVQHQPTHWHLF